MDILVISNILTNFINHIKNNNKHNDDFKFLNDHLL